MDSRFFQVIIGVGLILVVAWACAKASGQSGVEIRLMTAPDGSQCYVSMQDGQARGLSCR